MLYACRPYPWGSELLANLRAMIPPAVTMQLQVLEILSNRAVNCQLTLTRIEGTAGSTATVTAGGHASVGSNQTSISKWAVPMHHATSTAAQGPSPQDAARVNCVYQTHTPCKLLCGCSNTDQLLLMRSVVLETFASPLQVSLHSRCYTVLRLLPSSGRGATTSSCLSKLLACTHESTDIY